MALRRHTFIVHVREPDGEPMLENLRTHERVRISNLADIGGQIDQWLRNGTPMGGVPSTPPSARADGMPPPAAA